MKQQNVNSSKVVKSWRVVRGSMGTQWLECIAYQRTRQCHSFTANITGASPVYVEGMVERLNIQINTLLYELGRVPCQD